MVEVGESFIFPYNKYACLCVCYFATAKIPNPLNDLIYNLLLNHPSDRCFLFFSRLLEDNNLNIFFACNIFLLFQYTNLKTAKYHSLG